MNVRELKELLKDSQDTATVVMTEARRAERDQTDPRYAEEVVGARMQPTRTIRGMFESLDIVWLHD